MECELLPCGHCKTAMIDDQCGRPEHRYCGACREGECNETWEEDFGKMMDDRDSIKTKLDAALLQVCDFEKLTRALADQFYEAGKTLRSCGDVRGEQYMGMATNAHRQCQIIKGEEALPAAGDQLTEKRKCVRCGHEVPCPEHNKGL